MYKYRNKQTGWDEGEKQAESKNNKIVSHDKHVQRLTNDESLWEDEEGENAITPTGLFFKKKRISRREKRAGAGLVFKRVSWLEWRDGGRRVDGKVRINYFGAGLDSLRGRRGERPENVESFTVTRLDWMACIFMICTNGKTEIKRGRDKGTVGSR